MSPQIIREYLAVATRPAQVNGLGAPIATALVNVERLVGSFPLLPEDASTSARLTVLLRERDIAGRQVHDANIVAVALAHGASTIVTSDTRHFARFADLVQVEALS